MAVACELPCQHGIQISRFSRSELHRLVIERGVTDASAATIARWLAEDAISHGSTALGCSRATPGSWSAPAQCSISTSAAGKAGCCTPAGT